MQLTKSAKPCMRGVAPSMARLATRLKVADDQISWISGY
jgi:hypothetical protein